MDIEPMATRRLRPLLRRIIRGTLLLLVVLWQIFHGAWAEANVFWRESDPPAHISNVALTEDIIVLYHKEQQTLMGGSREDLVNFRLSCWQDSFSSFLWPICSNGWGADIAFAFSNDILYRVDQILINRKDGGNLIPITTRAGGSGRGEPIILEMVAEYGRPNFLVRGVAFDMLGRQPKAVENRADIGAELPLFGVSRNIDLVLSSIGDPTRIYRSPSSEKGDNGSSYCQPPTCVGKYSRPFNKMPLIVGVVIILLACVLSGKAFEILFLLHERKHGLPIIIFGFVGALVCVALGSFLIVRMT